MEMVLLTVELLVTLVPRTGGLLVEQLDSLVELTMELLLLTVGLPVTLVPPTVGLMTVEQVLLTVALVTLVLSTVGLLVEKLVTLVLMTVELMLLTVWLPGAADYDAARHAGASGRGAADGAARSMALLTVGLVMLTAESHVSLVWLTVELP